MRRVFNCLSLAIVLAGTASALAQDSEPFPPELEGMLGPWSLETDDEPAFQCTISLLPERGIGGFELSIPEECAATAPTVDLAAWYIDDATGDLVFIDALRQEVLRLQEMGDGGLFGSDVNSPPQYYLVPVLPDTAD